MKSDQLYFFATSALAAGSWALVLGSHFVAYDNNYVLYAFALLASLGVSGLSIYGLTRAQMRDRLGVWFVGFLLLASPVSLHVFVTLYVEFVGQFFKS